MINWEVIIWTCVTLAALGVIIGLILTIVSAINIKKRTSTLKDIHIDLKPGIKIMFCGGIYGKIVSVGKETVEVEISKNSVITISRYSIQNIL